MGGIPRDHMDPDGDAGISPFKGGHHGCHALSLLAERPENDLRTGAGARSAAGGIEQGQNSNKEGDCAKGAHRSPNILSFLGFTKIAGNVSISPNMSS